MKSRIIHRDEDVAEGAIWLAENEPRFAYALSLTGPLPLRRREAGFAALLNAIVGQQVSVASADAIWRRLEQASLTLRENVAIASEVDLRSCGLSRQKINYALALANSGVDYEALTELSDQDVVKILIKIKGIGAWTAEVYTMFSLGRSDVFAPGDLALQEAARDLFALEARPNEKELRQMALAWSPWQAVAARALWSYYRVMKNREGIS